MAIIDKPSDYFETKLYTGDDTNNRQISLGLTPDLTWIKARSVAYSHILFDRIRGLGFSLNSNGTNADRNVGSEFSWSNSGCTTDSFTVDRGSNESLNESGRTMVAWNWKAGGTAVSNTDGSITSSVSANQDAGFSIVSYTGTGSDATVGHGLGSTPKMIIFKRRDSATNWSVQSTIWGDQKELVLNSTGALSSADSRLSVQSTWTSTLFNLKTYTDQNASGGTYIAYCFAEKQGYSKFGSYTGNGSTNGTFVYTGFKPTFVMVKRSDGGLENWQINDTKRKTFNVNSTSLFANTSGAESTDGMYIDMLSNGFKARETGGGTNGSGSTYIYITFASNPFVTSSGVPTTAR